MRYESLEAFVKKGAPLLGKGPAAFIFAEDDVEIESTLTHHLELGFQSVILFAPETLELTEERASRFEGRVDFVRYDTRAPLMLTAAINKIIKAAPNTWMYYCFNAEYLFFPFSESRSIADMLTFHAEERRGSMLTYVLDLYPGDLTTAPSGVDTQDAYLDRSGYYALGRPNGDGGTKDRQLDFFGGLRWRFEEHIAKTRRRIDRISIFQSKAGLILNEDHTFNEEEYNTYACPWHHNLTAAVGSFRTAKALKYNAGSTAYISTFRWHNSVKFEWHSQQLLNLGLIEPGQWF